MYTPLEKEMEFGKKIILGTYENMVQF